MPIARPVDYSSCVMPLSDLPIAQKKEMAVLHATRFGAARQPSFDRDIGRRDTAIIVNAGDRLVAFTTFTVVEAAWRGLGIRALCSGDLVHDGSEEAAHAIAGAWMRHAGSDHQHTELSLYWLLATIEEGIPKYVEDLVKSCYVAGSQPGTELDLFTSAFASESLRGETAEDGLRFIMSELEETNLKSLGRRAFIGADLQDLIAL